MSWEPYTHNYWDGRKRAGWRRSDGAGYVLPHPDEEGRWWVSFAHPMLCGRPGWNHSAFGSYVDANAGQRAFDTVYALEQARGNTSRRTGRSDA